MRSIRCAALMLALAASVALAQPRVAPAENTIVLRAARLFDGKSDRVTSPGIIVVIGARIRSVGAAAATPAGAEVMDLGDATLLPGFIDAHTHLTMQNTD